MAELAFEKDRKKEYLENSKTGGNDFFSDYVNENRAETEKLLEKRKNERIDAEKRKNERTKKLDELSKEGILYIKGGLK